MQKKCKLALNLQQTAVNSAPNQKIAANFTPKIVAIATKFEIKSIMDIQRNDYVERLYAKSWNGKVKI